MSGKNSNLSRPKITFKVVFKVTFKVMSRPKPFSEDSLLDLQTTGRFESPRASCLSLPCYPV